MRAALALAMNMNDIVHSLRHKPDEALFWLLWAIHLIPVWLFTPFPTVDGPAHLYNSRILLELWRDNAFVAEFYRLNPLLQPNVLAHYLLAGLMLAGIPALLAEKILLTLIVALFPLTFRRLLKASTGQPDEVALLVFPFVYGFLFFMGFYNFLLGMLLGLFGLSLWVSFPDQSRKGWVSALLVATGLLILFAHLYAFAWYALFSGLVVLWQFRRFVSSSAVAYPFWKPALIWLLPLLPAIYFVAAGQFSDGESHRLSLSSLWRIIYEVQPAKGLDYGKANIYTQWLFWLLAIRFLFVLHSIIKSQLSLMAIGAIASLVLLSLALVVLPDGNALSGVMCQRTGLMWFLALLVLLASVAVPRWMKWLSRGVALMTSVALLVLYMQTLRHDQPVAHAVAMAARQLSAGAVVYVENASGQMLHTHVSNYLGMHAGVVISENYQAALPYFPVQWNLRNLPVLHLGEMSKPVKAWPVAGGLRNIQADFVLVISPDSVAPESVESLNNQQYFKGLYVPVYQDTQKMVSLYRRLPVSIFDL